MLFAARSANALHRLLDVLPVFAGDQRVSRLFTLVPGSEFGVDALAAIERRGAHTIPWPQALQRSYDLVLAASPKGELARLDGVRVLLPHGAGFSKSLRSEGSGDSASGLDPTYLQPGGQVLPALYALAHPSQVARLAALSPSAAASAEVVGDPTLERLLASRGHRERYRAALRTGARTLIVLTSTWGPESLLERRPTLPAELTATLPHDAYQLALVVHPNERTRIGRLDLAERLAPALDAGLILADPYEEWGAVLVAADAVITDHGSTALYAAALDRPLVAAYDGGQELIPGSPMDVLLAHSTRLDAPGSLRIALQEHRKGAAAALAATSFAAQGQVLERLRRKLYQLLGLEPPPTAVQARSLPSPAGATRTPAAFAVRIGIEGGQVRVERFPARHDQPAHHLAAEHGVASDRQVRGAGLLYRRANQPPTPGHSVTWTAEGWTDHALRTYPGCRTAAVVLSEELSVVRSRSGALLTVRLTPAREDGRLVRTDPAAVLSAVHAWLAEHPEVPAAVSALVGDRVFDAALSPATSDVAQRTL